MRALLLLAGLAAPAVAQDVPVFDPAPLLACLENESEDCIGLATAACMEASGGDTTYGMSYCLEQESDLWDQHLNANYAEVRDRARAADQGLVATDRQEPALQDMQRRWIAYRDAACAFEAARWSGGTGAGPAAHQCILTLTARQALWLGEYLDEGR
ncbi:lysozyme inhibitor LprI family protein [Paracoccus sp. (in: a-proteobacteria)]|uniref:lysozyme inhibitor LprI family protein n=1 Tax=Paracoccus sp. TaxID=267 RepID=UPI00396C4F05